MRAFTARRLARSLARDARVALSGMAAVLALVVLAATGCGENGTSSRPGGATPADGTESPAARQEVQALLAPADVSFEVIFKSWGAYTKEPQYFVWRQGNGRRRWDIVQFQGGQPDWGELQIETGFAPGVALGDPSMGCMWFVSGSLPEQVDLECSGGWGGGGFGTLVLALFSFVKETLPDQAIAGMTASCYSFDDPRFTVTALCVDSSNGIPLRLAAKSEADPTLTQVMEAVSVSMTEQDLTVPLELKEDPVTGIEQAKATVPISTLQLPDFSQFGE
jgi:hypothetical protein